MILYVKIEGLPMILDYNEYVTESGHKGVVNYVSIESRLPLFSHKSICPFCHTDVKAVIYQKSQRDYPEWLFGSFDQLEEVIQCPVWWEYKYQNNSDAVIDGIRASDIEYSSAILKRYDNSSCEVPIDALRQQLLKTPDIIYSIDPHKMEDLVRSVFSDFYPSCKVYSFGKTRDGGKDGILVDNDGAQILLQIKRRENPKSTEGVIPLRELMGVSLMYDNVDKFELIDCREFLKRIDLTTDKLPTAWESLLKL